MSTDATASQSPETLVTDATEASVEPKENGIYQVTEAEKKPFKPNRQQRREHLAKQRLAAKKYAKGQTK